MSRTTNPIFSKRDTHTHTHPCTCIHTQTDAVCASEMHRSGACACDIAEHADQGQIRTVSLSDRERFVAADKKGGQVKEPHGVYV